MFRWSTDASLIAELTPAGTGYGVAGLDRLQDELDTYAGVGLFVDADRPDASAYLGVLLDAVYDDDAAVIWPAS